MPECGHNCIWVSAQIVHIKEKLNVNINIRTRKDKVGKEIVKFVSIQTQEYNNENLFEARSMILNQSNLIDRTNHLSMISSAGHEHCIQKNSLMPSMAKMKLYDLLCSIQLEKYWPKFEKNQVQCEEKKFCPIFMSKRNFYSRLD